MKRVVRAALKRVAKLVVLTCIFVTASLIDGVFDVPEMPNSSTYYAYTEIQK